MGEGVPPTPLPAHSKLFAGWWKGAAPPRCTNASAKPGGLAIAPPIGWWPLPVPIW